MNEESQSSDVEIFECFSAHIEKLYKLPPLTSKIQAYMCLKSTDEGITFEELLEIFKVSKSSLSNSVNYLLSTNQIEYINKLNSRKRHFRMNPNYLPEKLEFLYDMIKHEYSFTMKIHQYRINNNLASSDKINGLIDVYIEHLRKSQELFQETIQQINKIQLENK